jgi:hypothetical protein
MKEEIYYESAVIRISFYPEIKTIKSVWKKKPNTEEFKLSCLQGVEAIKEKKAVFYISDVVDQGPLSVENSNWFKENIGLRGFKAGLRCFLIIMGKDILKRMQIENLKTLTENTPYEVHYLNSEEQAFDWIKKNS